MLRRIIVEKLENYMNLREGVEQVKIPITDQLRRIRNIMYLEGKSSDDLQACMTEVGIFLTYFPVIPENIIVIDLDGVSENTLLVLCKPSILRVQ